MVLSAGALSDIGREAARIVLGSPCVVCGNELPWVRRVGSCCGSCWGALPRLQGRCLRCAIPAPEDCQDFLCIPCAAGESDLEWLEAWGRYSGGLDRLVTAFKFLRHDFLASPLAELLLAALRRREDCDFEVVVPVPMHPARQRRRGFNQAELLARRLSRLSGIRCHTGLLAKIGEREIQSSLPREQRVANVRGVYRASPQARGQRILLVDDICTTGATLRACARALMARRASRVCAVVVARA